MVFEGLFFTICDGEDIIRLEPIQSIDDPSQLDWDRNWIQTHVTVKGGVFGGHYMAAFMTTDFELFKRNMHYLDKDFTGTAKFDPLEGQLVLNVVGDGLGHFNVKCIAVDQPGFGGTLSFSLSFDQTELSRLIRELDEITRAFPIKGDLKIKRE